MTQHSRKMERAAPAPRLDREKAGGAGGGAGAGAPASGNAQQGQVPKEPLGTEIPK